MTRRSFARRPTRLWGCAFAIAVFGAPRAAPGVTVLLKGQPQPVHGYLVRADDARVVVRVADAEGNWKERTIERAEIDVLYDAVDAARLADLDPARPKDYRDYAEELAEKRVDPEARDMSLRLFVIAAHLDPEQLGRGALLGMAGLARTDEEARRFRAMAYLLDPGRDERLLAAIGARPADTPPAANRAIDTRPVWKALELLRKGRYQEADTLAKRPGMDAAFAPYAGLMTHGEFLALCGSRLRRREPPPDDWTIRILRVERRMLAESLGDEDRMAERSTDWSRLLPSQIARIARPLRLETITEFDPRQTTFRDGRWHVGQASSLPR
ncbi:MAG: hypothetical protein FJ297_09610 [Planctomycetes bacterium]|nr:hypothetical protein [Planctomycetota bacterium]